LVGVAWRHFLGRRSDGTQGGGGRLRRSLD
jgi:hypothetical protein